MSLHDLAKTGWNVRQVERGAETLGGGLLGYGFLYVLSKRSRQSTSDNSYHIKSMVLIDLLKVAIFLGLIGLIIYFIYV